MGKIVTKNPLDVDNDILGKEFTVVQCEAREHNDGPGCVCKLIDRKVKLEKRYHSGFAGTASFHIEGSDKRVRLSEVGLANRMN